MLKKTFIFLIGFALCFLLLFLSGNIVRNTSETVFTKDFFSLTSEIFHILSEYKTPVETTNIQEGLLKSFVSSQWDPYTTYISPKEAVAFDTMIGGDFEGIGAYIEDSPNGVFIQGTLPGSPAQKAWLLPGDLIQSINGKNTFNMSADQAVLLIRWVAGTPVVLTIFSSILSTKKDVTLIRQKLELPILTDELHGDILYLHLFSFNDYSGRDVQNALEKYRGKYAKILLDLRDNGGGTLNAAVDVSSLFFSAPKIVSTTDGKNPQKYLSHGKSDVDIPVYILVNWQTASAAEILTSALHEHLKAPVFGTQTYGKWSVQELFPLSNGAQLKVTIAHWFTASGEKLDGKWITPDIILLPKVENLVSGKDWQKEEALALIQKRDNGSNTKKE